MNAAAHRSDSALAVDVPASAGVRGSAPTTAEIQADPDRILELYPNGCPECGKVMLEALTWKGRNIPDVTVGCWACGWIIRPPGVEPLPVYED